MKKKTRKDCYFGLHFDFHAVAGTKGIGGSTSADKIGAYLDAVKPDYVQIDTKGHPGYSSYRTECGTPAPGLVCDHLKIIREETAKRGILLFAHHSGIWDDAAGAEHPEWNVLNENGEPVPSIMDVCSEYADKRLIPQLKELAGKYGLDGAWVDGESWAARESFRPAMLEDFFRRTGFSEIDSEPDAPSRLAFRAYCRDRFFEYLKHYMTAVKAEYPDFEFASNHAFGFLNPYEAMEQVDYLSCDLCDLTEVRAVSRSFASQNKPWDIMGWAAPNCWKSEEGGFFPLGSRHLSRLCRCGASAISMGGGFQIVNGMTETGKIRMLDVDKMQALSEFLSARKPFNFRSTPLINSTAILLVQDDIAFSRPERARTKQYLFCARKGVESNLCSLVIDGGRPVDVVYEHHVLQKKTMGARKTLIVSQNHALSEKLKTALLEFAREGGNLLICGTDACRLFAHTVPDLKMEEHRGGLVYVADPDVPDEYCGLEHALTFTGSADDLCIAYADNPDADAPKLRPAVRVAYGKGALSFVGWDIFSAYSGTVHFVLRDIVRRILDRLDPEPLAYLEEGPRRAELIPAEKDGKLLLNVVNASEFYCDKNGQSFDAIPPLFGVTVAIRCQTKPRRVYLEPEHTVPAFRYDGKYLHVKLEKVDIHTVITVE